MAHRSKYTSPLLKMLATALNNRNLARGSNVFFLREVNDAFYDSAAVEKADKSLDAWIIALAKRMASQDHFASSA